MSNPPRNTDLYKFHRPKLRLNEAPIPRLRRESYLAIQNLIAYRAPQNHFRFPRSRCAAVLVALFVGRMGDLYVLLSRRASHLRTYAGDTALPGGKWEPEDRTLEETARREACEEIGLPNDKTKVPLLCVLEPFLAGNQLAVFPVVVLILDNTLRPLLNASEVASLFSHPLRSFLSSDPPRPPNLWDNTTLELAYHTYRDVRWAGSPSRTIRMHRFLTGREAGGTKPVYGLTAAILIRAASIAGAQTPLFEVEAPDQPSMAERFAWIFKTDAGFRDAARKEGIDPDKQPTTPPRKSDEGRKKGGRTTKARL